MSTKAAFMPSVVIGMMREETERETERKEDEPSLYEFVNVRREGEEGERRGGFVAK